MFEKCIDKCVTSRLKGGAHVSPSVLPIFFDFLNKAAAAEPAAKAPPTSGKYVAPAMRDGGVRRGESMPRSQKGM